MRVLEAVAAQPAGSLADRVCTAAETCLEASGAGVCLAAGDDVLETVCSTGGGQRAEALQTDLGEGPAYTAQRHGFPVLVDDLELDDTWPAFGPAAAELGLQSVFAFPLRSGTVRLGALSLYRQTAGQLSDEHHADALVFARLALDLFLALQHGRDVDDLDELFVQGTRNTVEIHQAAGIVSVQLGIAVGAALSLLRAHAYSDSRSLLDVAQAVVARRLHLGDTGGDTR